MGNDKVVAIGGVDLAAAEVAIVVSSRLYIFIYAGITSISLEWEGTPFARRFGVL